MDDAKLKALLAAEKWMRELPTIMVSDIYRPIATAGGKIMLVGIRPLRRLNRGSNRSKFTRIKRRRK